MSYTTGDIRDFPWNGNNPTFPLSMWAMTMTPFPFTTQVNTQMYYCQHCGNYHTGTCPKIKAIEYYPNGSVKRVEYITESQK